MQQVWFIRLFEGQPLGQNWGGSKIPWRFPIRIIITEFYLTLLVLTQKVGQNTSLLHRQEFTEPICQW